MHENNCIAFRRVQHYTIRFYLQYLLLLVHLFGWVLLLDSDDLDLTERQVVVIVRHSDLVSAGSTRHRDDARSIIVDRSTLTPVIATSNPNLEDVV